jgi:hypothetical protein
LTDTINITFSMPGFSACGEWTSLSTSFENPNPDFALGVNASGYINFWKILRQGETIVSSTVQLTSFKLYDNPSYYSPSIPLNVQFNDVNNPLNGYFGLTGGWIYFSNDTNTKPVEVLGFYGYIFTSLGRSILIDFYSYANSYMSVPTGVESYSDECTVDYVPSTCREWTIYNNSTVPIRFNGLNGNGKSIIGGIIEPNTYAKSVGEGGIYPVVRNTSLSAMGTGTVGGVIAYTTSLTCPLV